MIMVITGAAGFVGSHLVDRLLELGHRVIGIDNFSRGSRSNVERASGHSKFSLIELDLTDERAIATILDPLFAAESEPVDTVWHLAANSDIPAGVADARVDLKDTFMTTFQTLELMKRHKMQSIVFASTSAVYGTLPGELAEVMGPLLPISNYGAMKLASEGLISAAAEAYLRRAVICRFPNVVGARGTHGVIYDLLGKLNRDPLELEVLGDGTQKKPYLHVLELVDAMLFVWRNAPDKLALYNVGPEDDGLQVADIAATVLKVAGTGGRLRYTGGDRGWVGDVPRFHYSTGKLAALGWRPRSSSREAVERAAQELAAERGF